MAQHMVWLGAVPYALKRMCILLLLGGVNPINVIQIKLVNSVIQVIHSQADFLFSHSFYQILRDRWICLFLLSVLSVVLVCILMVCSPVHIL